MGVLHIGGLRSPPAAARRRSSRPRPSPMLGSPASKGRTFICAATPVVASTSFRLCLYALEAEAVGSGGVEGGRGVGVGMGGSVGRSRGAMGRQRGRRWGSAHSSESQ